jgi:ribosomal protein S27AE
MKLKLKRRKCRHCGRLFAPDHRNQGRQYYCSAPECRRASKFASQHKWLRKTENLAHFRGETEVRRVQEWRQEHPGYWKKKAPASNGTRPVDPQAVKPGQESCNACGGCGGTLQDVCLAKNPLFVGLLSAITGSTLQDDMAKTIENLVIRGRKILGLRLPEKHDSRIGPDYDRQTFNKAQVAAKNPRRG